MPANAGHLQLALFPFANEAPLRYVNDGTVESLLQLLELDPTESIAQLSGLDLELSHALRSLMRRGSSWGREQRFDTSKPEKLIEFEHVWHPEYQRYAEHIFNHLCRVPLSVLGARKGKKYTQMALSNRADLLRSEGLGLLAEGFDAIVRNAVSHGTVTYTDHSVVYRGGSAERELWPSAFAELFDALVSTCHGYAVGLLAFVARHADELRRGKFEQLPFGLRLLLINGLISHDEFRIVEAVESELRGEPEVNCYCRCTTTSRMVHMFESPSVAAAVQDFGGEKYARVLIHIDPGAGVAALAALMRDPLIQLRREGWSEKAVQDAYGLSLMWHDSSAIRRKIWLWRSLFTQAWREYKADVTANWRAAGLNMWGGRYTVKELKPQGTGLRRTLWAELVLNHGEPVTKTVVHGVLRHASKRLRRRLLRGESMGRLKWLRLPPERIFFRVHAEDGPLRTLNSGGWSDPGMVGQGEWIRWRAFKHPVWVKIPDMARGGLLVRFNPNGPPPP